MGMRHCFLVRSSTSTSFELTMTFNVLAFGLDGDATSLRVAIDEVLAMRAAARAFASGTESWSAEPERLGLFFHCYPHNTVDNLHLHLVDLATTGPSFEHLSHKNLPLDAVLEVLRMELGAAESGSAPAGQHPDWSGAESQTQRVT